MIFKKVAAVMVKDSRIATARAAPNEAVLKNRRQRSGAAPTEFRDFKARRKTMNAFSVRMHFQCRAFADTVCSLRSKARALLNSRARRGSECIRCKQSACHKKYTD
jgi:hypothetical protein